ncbi:MAG: ribbon-helix-helix protein, CopG family, partial [Nocardioides sp.]|nr:ribbon-helix-helix protein, CopG family [Nocardioides sp.]
MATTTIRVSEDTRAKVARLARARGISQAAYVEEIVAEKAAAQWEGDFWA